jgi:hypothetical protein
MSISYGYVFLWIFIGILILSGLISLGLILFLDNTQITPTPPPPPPPPPPSNDNSTIKVMNNTENELNVFFQLVKLTDIQMCSNDVINNYKNCIDNSSPFLYDGKCYVAPYNPVASGKSQCMLTQKTTQWNIISQSGGCSVSEPFTPTSDAIGANRGQVVTLPKKNDWCLLKIPDFYTNIAFRIAPVVIINVDGQRTMLSQYLQGAPTLIEIGKNMVGNMSVIDGTNYLINQEMTYGTYGGNDPSFGTTTIDYIGNPCKAPYDYKNYYLPGTNKDNLYGCLVGAANGTFQEGKNENSDPFYHLTGWLIDPRKTWCEEVHKDQCSDFNCTGTSTRTCEKCYADGYKENNHQTYFTTYCYDYNDSSSSPWFKSPFTLKLTFSNIAKTPPSSITIPPCENVDICSVGEYVISRTNGGTAGCFKSLETTGGDIEKICRKIK